MSGCPVKRMPKKSYASRSLISAVFHIRHTEGRKGSSRPSVSVRNVTRPPVRVDSNR